MPSVLPTCAPILLSTRPAADALALADAIPEAGRCVISPLIGIVPLSVAVPDPPPMGIVLTSMHGAEVAATLGLPFGLRAWCVGVRTAEAARAAGMDAVSAGGDADALVAAILRVTPDGPLWHLRGRHARGDVAARLTGAGVACTETVAYRQDAMPLTSEAREVLGGTRPVVVPLFSPRTAALLVAQGPFAAPCHVIAISAAVADAASALRPAGLRIAERPDAVAMIAATRSICRDISFQGIA